MTKAGRHYPREVLEGKGTFYRSARVRLPEGWPEQLRCPGCGVVQPTFAYIPMSRPASLEDKLYRVLLCPRRTCGNVFAPTPEYLRDCSNL